MSFSVLRLKSIALVGGASSRFQVARDMRF
jgi:hypothetical protein